jgi:4-amino-4-deoxy-L-arabinose transferase-like glycosyltransferase
VGAVAPAPAAADWGDLPATAVPRGPRGVPALPSWAAPGLVVLLAAVLRLARLGTMRDNPFYDAAVRSMGGSWHAFFTGAIDPAATVSVDKPPADLWLQVASTKLLGFTTVGLHLPEALGGTLAVLALYDLLHVLFGRTAALAGALALAVLPMAVITSRSDTMDSVMAALVIVAAALTARAARGGRPALLVAAGAVLGLAFQVKLFEALIAAPALVLLWWLGTALPRRRKAAALGAAATAFAVVALSWLLALPVLGGAQRPWAFGSSDGSAWNATFVYDGLDRVTGFPRGARPDVPRPPVPRTPAQRAERRHALAVLAHRRQLALAQRPAPPSPWRLFTAADHVGRRTGIALGLALLALAAALLTRATRDLDRLGRAGWAALAAWLGIGTVLFSAQRSLKPRYLEAVDPAVAAVLGVALVLVVRGLAPRVAVPRGALVAAALAIVLAAPLAVSAGAVTRRAEDAGAPGALDARRLAALSAYLRAHQGRARDEVAAVSGGAAASLIARDGRPVLVLAANDAHPLVSIRALARAIRGGHVRTVLLGAPCAPLSPDVFTGCAPVARWVRAHGVDVSAAAGQPHRGFLYAFPGGRISRGGRTGRPTSARSTRSRAARRRRPGPASRAARRRSARGRPRSRPGTAPR